ncbi:MAG: hypothetical protein R3F59_37240 [Myxococcota bacterium]
MRRRSLVVLLTAIVDGVNGEFAGAVVRALGSRHLPICVWMRDTDVDELTHVAPDEAAGRAGYVRAAAASFLAWREGQLAGLRKRGALVVDADPQGVTPALLHRYLEVKARRLL